MIFLLSVLTILFGALTETCFSAVLHVPSVYPHVIAAFAASNEGDSIQIAAGVYTGDGFHDILLSGHNVVIKGEGPDETILDIQGSFSNRRFGFLVQLGPDTTTRICDLTIKNGYASGARAGGITCLQGTGITLNNCVIDSCTTGSNQLDVGVGGGLHFMNAVGIIKNVVVSNCTANGAGGCYMRESSVTIENCQFVNNTAVGSDFIFISPGVGGAILSDLSILMCHNTFFYNNVATKPLGPSGMSLGGACEVGRYDADFINCTFVGNKSDSGSAIAAFGNTQVELDNCVIAYNQGGGALYCEPPGSPNFDVTCSNIFGNTGGDWTGCAAAQASLNGNISANPLFCSRSTGDLNLRASSPCNPSNNSCSQLIGAFPVDSLCEDCCLDPIGNVDCDPTGNVDIGDLTSIIDHLFIGFQPVCCTQEANVDGTGVIDIGDLTALIDHLFISFDPLVPCA